MVKIINEAELPPKLMICLRMSHNQGKSGTIRSLAELLMPKPAEANAHWFEPEVPPYEFSKLSEKISKWDCDICAALDVRGRRVGLNSGGDYPDFIQKNLKLLMKEGSEIIFCASRSRGQTIYAVEKMANDFKYTLIWTAPYSVNATLEGTDLKQLQETLNMKKAKHLKQFIGND